MLTWELLGALVGAGFASGREVAAFFARYGNGGYIGAALAAGSLIWLAETILPETWRHRWPGRLWRVLLSALLTATGGAMLSGAGEVAALVLPIHGAYWWGLGVTLLLAWVLARKTANGLAWVSRMMVFAFVVVLVASLTIPREEALLVQNSGAAEALAKGVCYGGFNAALLTPVLQNAAHHPRRSRRRALVSAGVITFLLLVAGAAVLQRQMQLMHETMPFIQLLRRWGKPGYYLGAACLYLAILSTLTACLRGLGHGPWGMFGIIMVSFLGFGRVVDYAYTILGGACMLMLLAAKFRNCSRKAFISVEDML